MRFRRIIRYFKRGNVSVCGLRGRGKDMLMANVVVRRRKPYVSNVDYGGEFIRFDPNLINLSGNTYKSFLSGNVVPYCFPYEDGTDFYISDVGVYFPSQYCSELNKQFPHIPAFMALTRHLGDCNFHYNVQNLNRCWDKIREMSDIYIMCRRCIVILGLVFQTVRIYEKYDSAVSAAPLSLSGSPGLTLIVGFGGSSPTPIIFAVTVRFGRAF